MLAALALLALGAVVLYVGAEAAVRGASSLARTLGVPAFALGALLFGIDLESLGAAVGASARGEPALAAGEIFGTVLFLFSVAFGSALLVARRPLPSPSTLMVLAPAAPLIAAAIALQDRFVERWEGWFLLALYATYVVLVVREGKLERERAEDREEEAGPARGSAVSASIWTVGGLALLAVGAGAAVAGATRFVSATGLSDGFVGAAVLGVLVSLDEVLLEVLPARRDAPELATGNLMGTLAAFCSGVLGVTAVVRPRNASAAALAFLGSATLYTVVATTFLARGRAGRLLGLFVLAFYAGWLLLAADV